MLKLILLAAMMAVGATAQAQYHWQQTGQRTHEVFAERPASVGRNQCLAGVLTWWDAPETGDAEDQVRIEWHLFGGVYDCQRGTKEYRQGWTACTANEITVTYYDGTGHGANDFEHHVQSMPGVVIELVVVGDVD